MNKWLLIWLVLATTTPCVMGQYQIKKAKTDSTKIIYRKEKFKCPTEEDVFIKMLTPLPYYCFYSQMTTSILFADSSNKSYFRIDNTYYFDDSSNFVAVKETSQRIEKGVKLSMFMIEEIKDSILFNVNLDDSFKRYSFNSLVNCHQPFYKDLYKGKTLLKGFSKKVPNNPTNIAGYSCEKYAYQDSVSLTYIWVTTKEDKWMKKAIADLNGTASLRLSFYKKGMVMAYSIYNKNDKTSQHFKVNTIDKDAFYKIKTIGDGMKF